jgi:D-alanine-D-alanine ligase
MKIKVGVIYGGETVEHEVSIISAVQAMSFINQDKYEIIPIYISKDRTWYTGKMLLEMDVYKDFESLKRYAKPIVLTKTNEGFALQSTKGLFRKTIETIDIAFPIVHGKGAEDGSLAGYLDMIGIPYVGPKMLGAALGQDKVVMKQVMEQSNINVPKYTWFYDAEYLNETETILKNVKKIGYPVIVKPANLGSSVGITVAKNEKELDKAINEAIKYDSKIVVEEMIDNLLEVNCAVLGNYEYTETSAIAEVITKNAFLTYEDKYIGNGKKAGKKFSGKGSMANSQMRLPAKLDKDVENKVKELSEKTFKALNLSGVARIDFLINKKTKEVYVNEPNTIPGSLSFYMWKPVGKDYAELLDDMITLTIKDFKKMSKKTTSFDTNILSTYNGSKGMKNKTGM